MELWAAADTVTPDGHAPRWCHRYTLADDRGPAVQKRLVFVARALSHPQVLTLAYRAPRHGELELRLKARAGESLPGGQPHRTHHRYSPADGRQGMVYIPAHLPAAERLVLTSDRVA